MQALEFPEVNNHIGANQDQVNTLPACLTPDGMVVVCFELNDDEIEQIVKHRRLWYHRVQEPKGFSAMNIFPVRDYFTQVIKVDEGYMISQSDDDEFLDGMVSGTDENPDDKN